MQIKTNTKTFKAAKKRSDQLISIIESCEDWQNSIFTIQVDNGKIFLQIAGKLPISEALMSRHEFIANLKWFRENCVFQFPSKSSYLYFTNGKPAKQPTQKETDAYYQHLSDMAQVDYLNSQNES